MVDKVGLTPHKTIAEGEIPYHGKNVHTESFGKHKRRVTTHIAEDKVLELQEQADREGSRRLIEHPLLQPKPEKIHERPRLDFGVERAKNGYLLLFKGDSLVFNTARELTDVIRCRIKEEFELH